MPVITFDTCIYISRKPSTSFQGFRLTAIVLQELTAGASDSSVVKLWNTAWRDYEAAGTLLVPTGEDWWMAGKVLNSLSRGLKSKNRGLTPKLGIGETQRIMRDVLIARVAKRAGAGVVTDNLRDFEKIRNFCNPKIISGDTYFGS